MSPTLEGTNLCKYFMNISLQSRSGKLIASGAIDGIINLFDIKSERLLHTLEGTIVSAHRRILGMASVVYVLVKICVSSVSLYKLDPDKLTTPFESAHQFTLVCTASDSKTVPGCHYNSCSNHSFVLTD